MVEKNVIAPLDARWLREGARDEAEYETFLARRAAGEPVYRILGWREFWGLKFFLSPETLEPRPDSETVIEVLLSLSPGAKRQGERRRCAGPMVRHSRGEGVVPPEPPLQEIPSAHAARSRGISILSPCVAGERRILDLGTGTGCLLLSALHEFPAARGVGVDAAAGAVATAQKNAEHLGMSQRAVFRQLDWNDTAALRDLIKPGGQFDVVLCNPPYIPSRDIKTLEIEVRAHDPRAALDGGADGLAPYRHLAPEVKHLLKPGGVALFEIGHDQAADVTAIFTAQNLLAAPPIQDLGGNDRVIVITKP